MSSLTSYDHLLYANAIFPNWSMMDVHWKQVNATKEKVVNPLSPTPKSPRSARQKKVQPKFPVGLIFGKLCIAYVVGCIGHALTLIAKIALVAVNIIQTLGLALYCCYLKVRGSQELGIGVNRFYLAAGTSIELVPALMIDCIGVACPPIAYFLHDLFFTCVTVPCMQHFALFKHTPIKDFNIQYHLANL